MAAVPEIKSSEDIDKRNTYRKKFRISALKGKDDPYVSSFLSANTNEEKVAILQKIKDTVNESEYNELKKILLSESVLTTGVLMKIK